VQSLVPVSISASQSHPLAVAAVNALRRASQTPTISSDRQVRQPDSWLLLRCWQSLAAFGTPEATFAATEMAGKGNLFSLFHALPILADRAEGDVGLAVALAEKLRALRFLLETPNLGNRENWAERLLAVAYSAARTEDTSLAFACLERMDQQLGIWRAIFARTDLREQLAQTLFFAGPHPLTLQLLRNSLRQYDESGSQFLLSVATLAAQQIRQERRLSASRRLLRACVDSFQTTAMTSLVSRKHAAITFGLAGQPQQILEQITIIANVQGARGMSSAYAPRDSDQLLLRQVRRPRANADADFQLYTLKEAVEALPPGAVSGEQRQFLADKMAELGAASDGWSAAAVATALVRLGAAEQSAAINQRIHPTDHSRSEAHRVLVQALLQNGDEAGAAHQAEMGVRWAQSLPEHHPERLTIWGIAEAYLAQGKAQNALSMLDQRRPPSFAVRVRRLFGEKPTEETLREEALRLRAALLQPSDGEAQAILHLSHIRLWAPGILDGKALALFYIENVLEPLLSMQNDRVFLAFLPDLLRALRGITNREFPTRVEEICDKLVRRLRARQKENVARREAETDQDDPHLLEEQASLEGFLMQLWEQSVAQGMWQTIYAVGGSLSLVIALAGSDAALEIAQLAVSEGAGWRSDSEIKMEIHDERDEHILS